MATLLLTELWIHSAASIEDYIRVRYSNLAVSIKVDGEIDQRANGEAQAIIRDGRSISADYELIAISTADADKIETRAGTSVFVRDIHRKLWGVLFNVDIRYYRGIDAADVSFTLDRVTFDESV